MTFYRVRIHPNTEDAEHLAGEEGLCSMRLGESGCHNLVVFLDCDGNDVPSYFGPHEVEALSPLRPV
jgi:hypothetical protein